MDNIGVIRALEEFQSVSTRLDPGLFTVALVASLAASGMASALYRYFYESRGTGSQVHRAFPLLGISITTLFIGVQLSIPLSLGLLGSLSIIRFRTPIKEPEEVGFIMLVIASAISSATFNFRFLVILHLVAVISLFLTRGARSWRALRRAGVLVLTLPDADAEASGGRLFDYLGRQLGRQVLESSSSREGTTTYQVAFSGLKVPVSDLQAGLRQLAPVQTVNLFLDRPGGTR